jgi:mono/diheme cytochrome c family protein
MGAHAGAPAASASPDRIARGQYLVTIGSCHDCHTPLAMTPRGPEPDMSRALSGHPADLKITAQPAMPAGPWMAIAASTMTAWSGPWGLSFTANLTPDPDTGLGTWTAEQFIAALRTGRHQGKGRPILPPMPWSQINKMTDDDLRAVFAYLQSIPPVRNRVPEPIDPIESGTR